MRPTQAILSDLFCTKNGRPDLSLLLDKVRRNRGLDFRLYRKGTLERRVQSRLRATGCAHYGDYLLYLNREPKEYDRLLNVLTINVTEFFRDPEVFERLDQTVIPQIVRSKKERGLRSIRAWSAGASDGEETYSLAILLREAVSRQRLDFKIKVYGTDLDPNCIEAAKRGIYGRKRLKKIQGPLLEKYFRQEGEDFVIREDIRRLTEFKAQNLISEAAPSTLDLILCRNVLIYFTQPLQDAICYFFSKALQEGGYLVMGKVESLRGKAMEAFEAVDIRERIYRKRQGQGGLL